MNARPRIDCTPASNRKGASRPGVLTGAARVAVSRPSHALRHYVDTLVYSPALKAVPSLNVAEIQAEQGAPLRRGFPVRLQWPRTDPSPWAGQPSRTSARREMREPPSPRTPGVSSRSSSFAAKLGSLVLHIAIPKMHYSSAAPRQGRVRSTSWPAASSCSYAVQPVRGARSRNRGRCSRATVHSAPMCCRRPTKRYPRMTP
jgi:hypothetical protein